MTFPQALILSFAYKKEKATNHIFSASTFDLPNAIEQHTEGEQNTITKLTNVRRRWLTEPPTLSSTLSFA